MNELPHNLDNERAVLGSVLLNREAITAVASWLTASMFYDERHAQIYAAMHALFDRRTPPDTRLLAAELKARGQLEGIGGVSYLSEVVDAVPTSSHIVYYARLVEQDALKRDVVALSRKIAVLGYSEAKSADEVRSEVLSLVTEVVTNHSDAGAQTLGEMMDDLLKAFGQDAPPAISTGLYDLDAIIYGIRKERLITIAGRPGHGKSALAMTIACNVARQGQSGLFFSMEMSAEELAQRVLSMHSAIDGKVIQTMDLSDDEFRRATETAMQVSGWPLWVRSGGFSLASIRTYTLQHIAEHGPLAFVVVDYIGLVRPSGKKGQTRQQEIGEITRGLKALAMETHADVLMLAQLNRDIEGRESSIPTLSDLREAGDIENDSNIVLFMINPEKFDPNTNDKGKGFVYVAKHRGGPNGKVELVFNAPLTRFDNLARGRVPDGY